MLSITAALKPVSIVGVQWACCQEVRFVSNGILGCGVHIHFATQPVASEPVSFTYSVVPAPPSMRV